MMIQMIQTDYNKASDTQGVRRSASVPQQTSKGQAAQQQTQTKYI
jgi:hypothetical protein